MPTRASKRRDPNESAFDALQQVIETTEGSPEKPTERPKNPAAVALSKLGASKGGKARAEALSAKRRAEIARKAAATRWKRKK